MPRRVSPTPEPEVTALTDRRGPRLSLGLSQTQKAAVQAKVMPKPLAVMAAASRRLAARPASGPQLARHVCRVAGPGVTAESNRKGLRPSLGLSQTQKATVQAKAMAKPLTVMAEASRRLAARLASGPQLARHVCRAAGSEVTAEGDRKGPRPRLKLRLRQPAPWPECLA